MVIRQPAEGYRVAIEPVLLAAALPAHEGELALELGSGVGAASLCVARRLEGCRAVGLELDDEATALARWNARKNGLADRVEFVTGDIADPPAPIVPGTYDHVFANPPFLDERRAELRVASTRTKATVEGGVDLAAWIDAMLELARPRGRLTIVHRADRLTEVLGLLSARAGAVEVWPVWPKADAPASRIIVRARRGVATPLALMPGLVLHRSDGRYTAAAEAILRGGLSLEQALSEYPHGEEESD
ncbi:MAG: tRNA1(Val) (adenine(37)-N6)-methyltransferase [Alphaproteobacteria bacterium]